MTKEAEGYAELYVVGNSDGNQDSAEGLVKRVNKLLEVGERPSYFTLLDSTRAVRLPTGEQRFPLFERFDTEVFNYLIQVQQLFVDNKKLPDHTSCIEDSACRKFILVCYRIGDQEILALSIATRSVYPDTWRLDAEVVSELYEARELRISKKLEPISKEKKWFEYVIKYWLELPKLDKSLKPKAASLLEKVRTHRKLPDRLADIISVLGNHPICQINQVIDFYTPKVQMADIPRYHLAQALRKYGEPLGGADIFSIPY